MPHPRLTLLLPCRDGFSVCRTVLPRCMRSGFESSDFLLSLYSVKSQRYAEKSLCPVVSPVSVCGGGPVPRRRILSLCRTRGAARTAHDRFDDLLPRRAVPFGPLRPSHRFQPAAGRAPAPRTGLHPGTHVAHGRCGFLPLPRGAAPARGRRTALCGACRRARGAGCGGRHAGVPVFGRGAVAAFSGFGPLHRPQLPRGSESRRLGVAGRRLAHFGGSRRPLRPRHARRRGLHQCRDRRTARCPAFRRRARTLRAVHRAALGAGHAALLLGGGFHAHGRPPLQPGMGLAGRSGAQLPRAARDGSAGPGGLCRAAVGFDLAHRRAGRRGGRREVQHARLVRRPYADARQLPLPAGLYRRPGDRAGVACRRSALHADRLGRTDPPEPHGGRTCGLCAGRPCRTALQPRLRRVVRHRCRRPADAPLRSFAPPRKYPFLQTDARPAGRRVRHGHRPLSDRRRYVQQQTPERPAASRTDDPRGRPLRLRLCADAARGCAAPASRLPFRPLPGRSFGRAGERRRQPPGLLREGAFSRRAVLRSLARRAVHALCLQGRCGLGLLPAPLPRNRCRGRRPDPSGRGPFLPAALQQPYGRQPRARTHLRRPAQLPPDGTRRRFSGDALRRHDARRHRNAALLRRHGLGLLRHGRDGRRAHVLRCGGRRRHPVVLPLAAVAGCFGRTL